MGRRRFHVRSILHVEYLSLSTSVDSGAGGVANGDPCGSHREVTTLKSPNRGDNGVRVWEKQKENRMYVLRSSGSPYEKSNTLTLILYKSVK